MVFRDSLEKENLWWRFIDKEKLTYYRQGHLFLIDKRYTILSVTIDGFRGLPKTFKSYPIQFCHFHQKKIIRRYVTKNPRLQAGIDLKEVVEMLGCLPGEELKQYLKAYLTHYKDFLNEKTLNPYTRRYNFTHPKLRSAINSLIRNLPHLFTYQKCPDLNIPTTTNTLESHFSHVKDITRIHRGLKRSIKQKVIGAILLNSSIVKPAKKRRS